MYVMRTYTCAILLAFVPRGAESHARDAHPRPTVCVLTLNIAHARGVSAHQVGLPREQYEKNIDRVAALIRDRHPDVVALQEADAPSAWSGGFDHVSRIADKAGLPHRHHGLHFDVGLGGLRIAYGTAILSRIPLQNAVSHRFRSDPLHRKGLVVADMEIAGRSATIVSLHLHSGSRDIRRKEAEQIIETLRDRDRPLIVMGDFNCAWSDETDALRRIASALELRAFAPERNDLATFRSTNPRRRIDWILISGELEFVSCAVLPERVSDHLAVEAEIRWRDAPHDR